MKKDNVLVSNRLWLISDCGKAKNAVLYFFFPLTFSLSPLEARDYN